MIRRGHLTDPKLGRLVFFACFAAYVCAYIGRLNYAASIASIVRSGLMEKSEAGLIATLFFCVYGAGQLINGNLADRVSPFLLIFIGLTVSATSNAFMGLGAGYEVMLFIWGLNGFAQSMLWTPIVRIMSKVLPEEQRYRACLYMAVSFPVGTLSAYGIAAIAAPITWKISFITAAVVLTLAAVMWFSIWMRINGRLVDDQTIADGKSAAASVPARSGKGFIRTFIVSGSVILLVPIFLHGTLKEGVMAWVPTLISESYDLSASLSTFITMIIPLIDLGGTFLCTYIYNRFAHHNEVVTALLFMACAVPPLAVMLAVGKIPMPVCVAMLTAVSFCMTAFNHMFVTLAPLRFASCDRCSTVSGTFNFTICLGCAAATYGFGFIAQHFDWVTTIGVWIGIAVLACVVMLFALRSWKKFISR